MDPLWIAIAFALGFVAKQIKLPPLLGFLAAGFVLNAMGVVGGEALNEIADLGILLLLFSIGLKLNIKDLLLPMIWAGTTAHMIFTIVFISAGLFLFSLFGLSELFNLSLLESALIAFALSFSSTVFAIKILEENGTASTMYGKIAIGVLIMQDIIAVVFLTFAAGKAPSPWALALILLLVLPQLVKKFPLSALLNRSGHGELLVLLGILIPIGGAYLFEIVGLKPDLGALVFGVLLANHPKANELSKSMLSFKDLFLVGFFLTIGLSGIPTLASIGVALLLTLLLPVKVFFYFITLTRFKLRARTAFMSSLTLANYSEFGLIVGAAGLANGWIDPLWLVIFALALSFSFILASPFNMAANKLYARWQKRLQKFETQKRLPDEQPLELGNAEVVILGMGRVGTSTYDVMNKKYGKKVLGIEYDNEVLSEHLAANRNVLLGDITDSDFWDRVQPASSSCIVILATSKHAIHLQVIEELKSLNNQMKIAALCRYKDERRELEDKGVDFIFNLYSEAGTGYADHIFEMLNTKKLEKRRQ